MMIGPHPENIEKVIAAIEARPMTIPEISRAVFISQPTTQRIIGNLRAEELCFVLDYKISDASHARAAIYAIGKGKDAPRPPRVSKRESNRKYKEKRIEEVVAPEEAKLRARVMEELSRPAFRHWMDVAFFGPANARPGESTYARRTVFTPMTITQDDEETV